jgi:alkanesulfonate monooxygenase SsuD/methylene tetrahydromethanopterin reductase-like flavin-dependent oxidoreductase (luciferase family)
VRLAEEVATLDHLSQGRLNLGIGRSSFPRAYDGYNIPYEESRERFQEYLEVMQLAWTQQRFSYHGRFYTCRDLEVIPKPYQQPHPPLYHAAASRETFAAIGTAGYALLVALIGTAMSDLATALTDYRTAWQAARHPGDGEVQLRLPVYVADTLTQAQTEPYSSVMPYYERLRQGYLRNPQPYENAERTARAAQLATLTYAELLQERVVFGTPDAVTKRLCTLQQSLSLSGFIIEPNVGGGIPAARVARSIDLFMRQVVPQVRETA